MRAAGTGGRRKNGGPHIGKNPLGATVMGSNIAVGFERSDRANAAAYAANAAAYEAKLVELDNTIPSQLRALTNRNVVTDHDAFDYELVTAHAACVLDTRHRIDGPHVEQL